MPDKTIDPELKSALDALRAGISAAAPASKLTQLQAQVDAIDVRLATKMNSDGFGFGTPSTLLQNLQQNESVARLLKDRRGSGIMHFTGREIAELMDRKTIISSVLSGSSGSDTLNPVGSSTSGVLAIDRTPGIVAEARQVLRVRDVLSARPTTLGSCDFVKVSSPMAIASPVGEGATKPENSMSFATQSEKVRVLATWIPATRQVLDDFAELMSFIQGSLSFYVNLAEETQLLSGDGTGENLHGLIPQASSFNAGLLPSAATGWQRLDVIAAAIAQISQAKEISPDWIILHPADWLKIQLTKTTQGAYLLGNPSDATTPRVFGLAVVSTTSIAQGTFLVGSSSPVAVEIRDRLQMTVEVSTEHASFFTSNLVAVRAEKRLCVLTKRPASLITGTFSSSPVS